MAGDNDGLEILNFTWFIEVYRDHLFELQSATPSPLLLFNATFFLFEIKHFVSTFVFLTLFLFESKVVSEGFVFRTVTTFGAALEIIFQLLGQIGKPM